MQRNDIWKLRAGGAVALVAVAAIGLAVAQANGTTTNASDAGAHDAPRGPGLPFFGGGPHGGGHAGDDARAAGGHGAALADDNGTVTGRDISFTYDAASATVSSLAVNGTTLVSSVQLTLPAGATASGHVRGPGFVLGDGAGDAVMLRDDRGAQWGAASRNGTTVTITLPAGATIAQHDAVASWSPAGATITYADGKIANLVLSKNATLTVSGQAIAVTLGPQGALHYALSPPDGGGREGFGFGGPGFGDHDGRGPPGGAGPRGHR